MMTRSKNYHTLLKTDYQTSSGGGHIFIHPVEQTYEVTKIHRHSVHIESLCIYCSVKITSNVSNVCYCLIKYHLLHIIHNMWNIDEKESKRSTLLMMVSTA